MRSTNAFLSAHRIVVATGWRLKGPSTTRSSPGVAAFARSDLPAFPALRWLAGLFLSVLTAAAPAQQRIASLNLCTDLLLLELVPRSRIVSLSYWAADPGLSYLAGRAAGLPLNKGLAEQIVPRRPDLILAGQFSDTRVTSLLRELGYRVSVLDVPLTLSGMRAHLLAFGDLVGEPAAARALADDIDRRLKSLSSSARELGDRPLAVVYGPQGVSPGAGTLMDELLALAGFRNLATEAGIVSYGTLSLEHLVMAEPQLLVLDDLAANNNSIAHRALRHPVLADLFPPERVISLPPAWTACVGPAAVNVAEALLARRLAMAVEKKP